MIIKDELLTVNEYSRPGRPLDTIKAVVMHWTGNPGASAQANRDFFESRKTGTNGFGSAHYIVGIKGEVIRCIPDNEIAYHCGSSQPDPKSKKVYTDYARQKFGVYALASLSPNLCTIGIEMCPVDSAGTFSAETLVSAAELVKELLAKFKLAKTDITTHNAIVGWKDCPRLWVNKPEEMAKFIAMI